MGSIYPIAARCTFLLVGVALAGCGTLSKDGGPIPKNELRGARVDVRPQCLVATGYEQLIKREKADGKPKGAEAGILAGLASALVPSVLNKVSGFVTAYAEKVGKEYSSTSTAATAVTLADGDIRGCVTYVVGHFGDATPESDGEWSRARLKEFGLVRRPDVYAEIVLHAVDGDGKYVAITPVYLEFNAPQAKRTSSDGVKELSFVLELGAPSNGVAPVAISMPAARPAIPASGAKTDAPKEGAKDTSSKTTALATFPLTFGTVAVGSKFNFASIQGAKTQSQILDKAVKNVNLSVTAIETESGGDFYLQFSSFLEENQKSIVDTTTPFLKGLFGTDQKK
jgi:hypothetical protein